MFTPVRKNILRWGTPDPEGDWIMYGHLVFDGKKCTMVDPPLVPGLLDSVNRIGKLEAIILTTLDHTRGAKYISEKTGATLFIPPQDKSLAVDPEAVLAQKEIKDFQKYDTKEIQGLRPYRITVENKKTDKEPWMDEFALLTDHKEMIAGDIAIGTSDGKIFLAPEWFPHDPPHQRYSPAEDIFSKIVRESGATSLLASHGENVYGTLHRLDYR